MTLFDLIVNNFYVLVRRYDYKLKLVLEFYCYIPNDHKFSALKWYPLTVLQFYKSEVWQSLLISQGWNQGVWAGVLSGDSREESNLRFIQVIGRIQFLVVKELMPCCQLGHSQLLNATHISWHAAPLHLQSQQWCVKSSTCFQSLNSVFFFFSLLLLLAGKDTLLLKGLCD